MLSPMVFDSRENLLFKRRQYEMFLNFNNNNNSEPEIKYRKKMDIITKQW